MAHLRRKPNGYFYLVDKSKGEKWVALGRIKFPEARQILKRYNSDQNYLRLDLKISPTNLTLNELAEKYLADIKTVKAPYTVQCEGWYLRRLCDVLGKRKIESITAQEIEKLLSQTKYSANTKRLFIRSIRGAYGLAVSEQFLKSNPMKEIRLPKLPKIKPKHTDLNTIRKLLEVMSPKIRAYFEILMFTGCRPSEALRLQVRHITKDGILFYRTKTNDFKLIPINPRLKSSIKLLTKGKEGTDYLWESPNGGAQKSMRTGLRRALKITGIAGVSPYTFRHTYATYLLKQTGDLKIVKEALGHAQVSTTERYAWVLQEDLQKAIKGFRI